MTSFEESFGREEDALRKDIDYRLEGFYLDIVENISSAMERADLSKSDLAAAMKVTPARVTNLMRGYKTNIELRTIVQVALALQIEPHDLCARRKTREMLMRPLQAVPNGFVSADIAEERKNGKEQAA